MTKTPQKHQTLPADVLPSATEDLFQGCVHKAIHPVNKQAAWDPGGWNTRAAYEEGLPDSRKIEQISFKNQENLKIILFL